MTLSIMCQATDPEKTHFQIIIHKVSKVQEKGTKCKFSITQISVEIFKQVDLSGFALILWLQIIMKKWMLKKLALISFNHKIGN